MVSVLFVLKSFHWLAGDRVDYVRDYRMSVCLCWDDKVAEPRAHTHTLRQSRLCLINKLLFYSTEFKEVYQFLSNGSHMHTQIT